MLHKKIMDILNNSKTLTQRGLAEFMGLDPAAVNRMLHGRRNIMAQEIPLIEQYLGQKIWIGDDYPQAASLRPNDSASRHDHNTPPRGDARASDMIPVLGRGCDHARPLEWTQRHPRQTGLQDAFAFLVEADDMAPRYERGNIAYIHPRRPAMAGQDGLFVTDSGDAFLARLEEETRDGFVLRRLGKPARQTLKKSALKQAFLVLGIGF